MDCCAKSSKETPGRLTRKPSTDSTSHSVQSPTTPGRSYLAALLCCKGRFKAEDLDGIDDRGLAAYVAENDFSATTTAPGLIVNDARKAMSLLSAAFYGYPQNQLKIIGITGTKGKNHYRLPHPSHAQRLFRRQMRFVLFRRQLP